MMGTKMAEAPKSNTKRRFALRDACLTSLGLAIVICVATTLLNQNPAGEPPAYSPAAGILIVTVGVVGLVALTVHYLKRTDEHDLLANLWGLTFGYVFLLTAAPAWWMLHHSGLVGPANLWVIYFGSGIISAVAWAWYRFR